MKQHKKIKVTYKHPDGRSNHFYCEPCLLGPLVDGLMRLSRVWDILCNGMSYKDYVLIHGGLVLVP